MKQTADQRANASLSEGKPAKAEGFELGVQTKNPTVKRAWMGFRLYP